jgi:hypothetical protein
MLKKILNRLYFTKSQLISNPFLQNETYSTYFVGFNDSLKKLTDTKLEPLYKLRFYEIYNIVKKHNIKSIVEMGSGRTTFVFNIIQNVKCVSIEQDKNWFNTIDGLLKTSGINAEISVSSVSEYENGARFDELPNLEPDLLYIDAPYFRKEGQKKGFATHTGKAAYYDFETFFSRGVFPKVIMIEGRTDTADAILKSEFSNKYDFVGEFTYCIQRKKYLSSLTFSRHSIFTLKH